MTFLPGGRQALITEKTGRLKLWTRRRPARSTSPACRRSIMAARAGFGDVVLHPDFAANGLVYLSFAEAGEGGTRGAAVGRGRLVARGRRGAARGLPGDLAAAPKYDGRGHYGHRIAFSPDGRYLFISSGERQEFTPAQDMAVQSRQDPAPQPRRRGPGRQSVRRAGRRRRADLDLGHRNPLGLAFAPDGRLWEVEMGPRGGDEMNLIERGAQLRLSARLQRRSL